MVISYCLLSEESLESEGVEVEGAKRDGDCRDSNGECGSAVEQVLLVVPDKEFASYWLCMGSKIFIKEACTGRRMELITPN